MSPAAAMSWDEARGALAGLPGGGLNIAYEALERHASGARAGRIALRALPAAGGHRALTFAELARFSNRFANLLRDHGVGRGDVVFVLCPRVPELYAAVLAALKCGAVAAPLAATLSAEALATRINLGRGKLLVTTEALFQRHVADRLGATPSLEHVLRIDGEGTAAALECAGESFPIERTTAEDAAFLHFTAALAGAPQAALQVHGALVGHYASAATLDLHPDDVFWCSVDPAEVTGTAYGVVAPLAHGVTSVVDEAPLDAARCVNVLEREAVNVWYATPEVLRMLKQAAEPALPPRGFPRLRFVASLGEALDAETRRWCEEALGRPVYETG